MEKPPRTTALFVSFLVMVALAGGGCSKTSNASKTSKASELSSADRAAMSKSVDKAKLDAKAKKCVLNGLESKLTRDEYISIANAKAETDIPKALNDKAGEIAIGCVFDATKSDATGS